MITKSQHLLAEEYAEILEKITADSNYLPTVLGALAQDEGEQISIKGTNEGQKIDLYIYRPSTTQTKKTPIIYYAHGGGYLRGNASMYGSMFRQIVNENQVTLVSVEYRLATEAPYPADLHDAYAGLEYIYTHADELNLDKDKIIIMGESAGAGLTARLALYNKDQKQIPIKGQMLIYPMLDYRTGGKDDLYNNPYAGEFLWTNEANQTGWQTLQGNQTIPSHEMPYFSAATATVEDLKGLPTTFIVVGALDLFVNEDMDYANKLIQAGVPTEAHCIPGVFHGFDCFATTPQTIQFNEWKNKAIQRMLV